VLGATWRIGGTGMKIEIGEFLILSWLRHVRGCIITQMNWSPSPAWPIARERELRATFEAIRTFSDDTIGPSCFGQVDFATFVRHASIDVLGLRLDQATGSIEAIAVDSAINDTELPHGGADETIVRLIERMTRAGFALAAYLAPRQATVVFATPWLAMSIRQEVQRHLALLERRLAERPEASPNLRFRVIADGDFADEIVQPVLEHVDAVADTRGLVGQPQRATPPGSGGNGSGQLGADRPIKAAASKGDRIGEHVRRTMYQLAASGRLTARVVGDLLDARYCKARFNLGHPFLKPVAQGVPLSRQGNDRHGRGRYWKKPLKIGGHEFLMCSQWFAWQRDAFDTWVRDIERGNPGGANLALATDNRSETERANRWP
jgi:hypothetical protein